MKRKAKLFSFALGALLLGAPSAWAQTSCNFLNQAALLALFSDNAPNSSITPANIRALVCSLMGGPTGTATPNWVSGNLPVFGNSGLAGNTTGSRLVDSGVNLAQAFSVPVPLILTDNKTGAIVPSMEGAIITGLSEPGVSAQQIQNWALCNCTQPVSYDALRGVAVDNGGQTIDLVNGVGGYIVSSTLKGSIAGGFPTGVALFGVGVAAANGANVWGINTLLTDNKGQVLSSGTGEQLNNEFDFNVTSPHTAVLGLVMQGASLVQPVIADAFVCGPLSFGISTVQWSSCLQSDDFVDIIALNIGVEGSANTGPYPPPAVAGTGSQFIQMGYYDSAPTRHLMQMQTSLEGGNGGGLAGVVFNSDAANVAMELGLPRGGFWTGDNNLAPNGFLLGAQATSGTSVNSQFLLMKYWDAAGTSQNLSLFAKGGASPVLEINSTTGTTAIQIGANLGLSCSGTPTSSFASVGGIVTHC